ncbi:MAG: carboxypeptidase regulatory-like domain-containing protein [Planctomycetia bacterium]|nr:carboxypeptidase regulatory-like domain-containing protein [Planctomycetia bacterium]
MSRRAPRRRLCNPASRVAKCRTGIERLETRSLMTAAPLAPALPPPSAPTAIEVRSLDGTGNNALHPEWGSTDEQLLRHSAAAYADGVSAPSGADRPSARLVSNLLSQNPAGGVFNDRDWSAFVYAWGQFLDHDIGLTDTASPRERFPITVPVGDPWFDPAGTGTMTISLSRSASAPGTGTSIANPRQQTNEITAFIDGSQIYGSDVERAAALRTFVGGRLATSAGNLLPFNTAGLANANDAHRVADSQLFLAGDVRANENPELLSLQTLFVREHNRLADEAARRNPALTDEQLYQHARRLVIAELQKITFDEFLPALLGSPKAGANGIAAYRGYRADVNPGIATEFSTVAFRVGHSMLGEDIDFLAGDGTAVRAPLSLRDAFFNPTPLSEVGIDPILKYLASVRGQEIDTKVVDDVRNFLFGAPGQGGFDLAALNIQRGRDHGIGTYNAVRLAYGLPQVTSFTEITTDVTVQRALQQAYGSVDTIDPWVGGLAETHLPGSSLGATFTRIIVDQFTRLRDGDRFWYQSSLPADLLRGVQTTTLADVIRRNTQLTNLQPKVFVFQASISGSVFADGNRDGQRQSLEAGLANVAVTLVNAAGTTVASTRTNQRGEFTFAHLDLGSFRVVVTPVGSAAVTSRSVVISRGGALREINLGLAPPPAKPLPPKPLQGPTGPRPLPPAPAAFAALGSDMPNRTGARPIGPLLTSPAR